MTRLVSVAVPVPALPLLTYGVPDDMPLPPPGARVVVPLGRRTLTGVVIDDAAAPPAESVDIKPVVQVLDAVPFLPPEIIALTAWVSDYYLAGPGAALAAAMPPHALTDRVDAFRMVQRVSLTAQGSDVLQHAAAVVTPRQRHALQLLQAHPDGLSLTALATRDVSGAIVSRLRAAGLVSTIRLRQDRDPFTESTEARRQEGTKARRHEGTEARKHAGQEARELTPEQHVACTRLRALLTENAFVVALLHGVTGSGKTEVYLQLAAAARAAGRTVLMLVPEIALTPTTAAVFQARFPGSVAVQHSGLSHGERHDQWHRIRRGEVTVVIGTRSAVFAPLPQIGVIIVDEEHDASYKQEEMPRYHGRDVAIMRGKLSGALVVLGSATPSLESYDNARRGRYHLLTMSQRVFERPLPSVRVVDMREVLAEEGPEVVLAPALRAALQQRLAAREQSLVLLNRRGYATAVLCRQCGDTLDCPNCSVSLTVHGRGRGWSGRCHYCNYTRAVAKTCARCAAPYLEHIGVGTERLEENVRALLPEARVARIDRDTVRRRGSLATLLARFARHELDVIVGTQMIAKGHDFPRVTLVGVVSADVGLGVADFRAAERTFQLLTQVAGRAGRGEQPGEAIVQTLFPWHYSIQLAPAQDYPAFFAREVEFRRTMRYPPALAMINIVVRGTSAESAMDDARTLADRTWQHGARGFALLGPAPAPLPRLRGDYRAQFFLKGSSRRAMRTGLQRALAELPELARRVAVDVDPQSVL